MSLPRILGVLLLVVAFGFMVRCSLDPARTRLPFGTKDLSSVEEQLAQLSESDRALVEAYVRRSGGDVLPERFADPEAPLTARTFAEAIKLEKDWQAAMGEQRAVAAEHADKLNRTMERIREVVAARVVRREILPMYEPFGPNAPPPEEPTVFTVTVRVENRLGEEIVALRGGLTANDRANASPLELCQIVTDERERIPAHGNTEIRCAVRHRRFTDAERAFVEGSPGRFTEVWSPRYVKYASGKTIDAEL